jgi:hypothetical protein
MSFIRGSNASSSSSATTRDAQPFVVGRRMCFSLASVVPAYATLLADCNNAVVKYGFFYNDYQNQVINYEVYLKKLDKNRKKGKVVTPDTKEAAQFCEKIAGRPGVSKRGVFSRDPR